MDPSQNPPRKRGCFFYGCLALLVMMLIAGVLGYVGYRYASNAVNRLVNDYTDTAPAPIEKVELSPSELNELKQRMGTFAQALQSQQSAQELVLTARDINALIATESNLSHLKDRLFVMIDDDRITGKISWPLENIGPLKLKGRFLNGVAAFNVSLEGTNLNVRIDSIEVKGKPLPPSVLAEFQKQNFAEDIRGDPEAAEALRKFDRIQVQDGAVVLKNRVKQ